MFSGAGRVLPNTYVRTLVHRGYIVMYVVRQLQQPARRGKEGFFVQAATFRWGGGGSSSLLRLYRVVSAAY